ncbi:MAG TPA: AraC family transcriptional regulator [Bacilli bacterium]|nr:AraC family transcriptional regulator [Bacilli bacterium]
MAFEVGIGDAPYFNRLFKKKTDMTPLDYRKNG